MPKRGGGGSFEVRAAFWRNAERPVMAEVLMRTIKMPSLHGSRKSGLPNSPSWDDERPIALVVLMERGAIRMQDHSGGWSSAGRAAAR
jgi:hypothetical protein